MTRPLLFIHGAFCGGWAFDAFRAPFEAAGFATHAPDLPFHAPGSSAADLANVGVRGYAKAIAEIARDLPAPPVLIGHSLGGLVAQLVAMRQPVAGLVLLAPSPPWGVMATTPEEHAGHVSLTLMGDYWRRPVAPDYAVAREATLDRLDSESARRLFARFTPESGRAMRETLHWWLDPSAATAAPAYRISAPVLALAGGRDRVNAAATVRRIARRFPETQATFREFPEMSHWLIEEPGWENVAAEVLSWVRNLPSR